MTLGFPKPDLHKAPNRDDKRELRELVYMEQGNRCNRCRTVVYLRGGNPFLVMQLHHIRGGIHRRNWTRANVEGLCLQCHNATHNPKPCPPKP